VSAFAHHDIILTTYGIASDEGKPLVVSLIHCGWPGSQQDADAHTILDLGDVNVEALARSGPLYKIKWRRIVFDEVSILRNRRNKFKAAHMLDGVYRWCLDVSHVRTQANARGRPYTTA